MKKLVLFVLLLPALVWAQSGAFGHGGSSLDLSSLLPILADSIDWTAGSHIHAIKPKDGKSIEADSGKFGALHVTGITTLDGDLTMVTTAGEQVQLGTGSDAAPELSSAGDTDTGIRFTGGDKMQLVQGGLNSHTFRPYRYTITYSDGDTLGMWLDATYAYIKTNNYLILDSAIPLYLRVGGVDEVALTGAVLSPGAHKGNSLGAAAFRWLDAYIAAGVYIGGKGETPTFTLGTQKVQTEQTDSTMVFKIVDGNPVIDGRNGNSVASTTNNRRQFYFGPDTLALFNGAKTGRDSTVYILPDGKVYGVAGTFGNVVISSQSIRNAGPNILYVGTGNPYDLVFRTNDIERGRFVHATDSFGLGTTTPQAKLSVVGADGTGTGIQVVSSDVNINRSTWAQATDTSSVEHRLDSVGNGLTKWVAADGDSARIHVRTDSTEFYSKNALVFDAPAVLIGASNVGVSKIDTVFTAGFVPRWVKFTSGGKEWVSPVYAIADTTGKW